MGRTIYAVLRSGVRWQSGDASDCKSADAGSIPARTSNFLNTINISAGDGMNLGPF
jgi:hypothetical protein